MNPQADFSGFSRIGDAYIAGRNQRDRLDQIALENIRDVNERADRKNLERDKMIADLGDDAVMMPDGNIDVRESMKRKKQRADNERMAEVAGELEALGMEQPIPEELRALPSYKTGKARALAKKTYDRQKADMELEIENARISSRERIAGMKAAADLDETLLKPGPKEAPEIEVTEDPVLGTSVKKRFKSQEAYDAYRSKNEEAKPAKLTPAQQALKDMEDAMAKGQSFRLVEGGDDNVRIEATSTRPDNPEIVRRRLQQIIGRSSKTNAPARVINFKDLGIPTR